SSARQAATSSSSLGGAILPLPEYVVDLVLDFHAGTAAGKAECQSCHFRRISLQTGPFRPRIEKVEQHQPSIPMSSLSWSPSAADLPHCRAIGRIRLGGALEPRRIRAPGFTRQLERSLPFLFVEIYSLITRRQQASD